MRHPIVLVTTLALALPWMLTSNAGATGASQTPTGNSTVRFATAEPAVALPATFGAGIQYADPNSYFSSISCSSPGNCVAVGRFTNAAGSVEAFTQTQANDIWDNAIPATFGAGIQNAEPRDSFSSISCSSPGNCVAVGQFLNAAGSDEAFTQTQANGRWANAIPATFGAGIQSSDPYDFFHSISCSSPGNCVAVGQFLNAARSDEAFTQTQKNGRWANAIPATFGAGIQNAYPRSHFNSVSCSSPGNCVAVGQFLNAAGSYEAFTQAQTNNRWANAIPATFGAGIQNAYPRGSFRSVSCSSPGNCVAAGQFFNSAEKYEAFTQAQTNNRWANAIPAKFGAGIQNPSSASGFNSVSCSSPGNCVAAGQLFNADGSAEAFTQTQANGIWANAIPAMFGAGIQSPNQDAEFWSVSCHSLGHCVAAGYFKNAAGSYEAFTQTQANGIWANAIPAMFGAGIQYANPVDYFVSVSCSSAGNCVAVGEFKNAAGGYEAFSQEITKASDVPAVTPESNQTSATKSVTFTTSSSTLTKVHKVALKKLVTKAGKKGSFVVTGTAGKLPGVTDKKIKALATKRGEIVKAYLVTLGVSKSKVTVLAKITSQGIVPKTKILAKYLVG